jgi:hypothetical protein
MRKFNKNYLNLFTMVKNIVRKNQRIIGLTTMFGDRHKQHYNNVKLSQSNFIGETDKMSHHQPQIIPDENVVHNGVEKIKTEYCQLISQINLFLNEFICTAEKKFTQTTVQQLQQNNITFLVELLAAKTPDDVINVIYKITFKKYPIKFDQQISALSKLALDDQQREIINDGITKFKQVLLQHGVVVNTMSALAKLLNELKASNYCSDEPDIAVLLDKQEKIQPSDIIAMMKKYFETIKSEIKQEKKIMNCEL